MNISLNRIFFVGIIVLAAILRLWKLGEYPIHLTNDEAALGYNAYSILKTGRDEHRELLPIVFKSFGDWKPGLYVYLTVPFVFLFNLNEVAVRLPSALFGVGSILIIYLIANKLFNEKIALFAAFALAVMPWHIHFSRGAWEANVALTIVLLAIFSFLEATKNSKYLIVSAFFFGISLWVYQSAKVASFIPLLSLILIYKDKVFSFNKKHIALATIVGLLLSLPILFSILHGKGGRLEVMSVFSYARPKEYLNETILNQENIRTDSLVFSLFHSEAFNFSRGIIGRYFNYFSGRFLFFEGDWTNPKHTAPDAGYVLYATIPFLLLGIATLFKESDKRPYMFIILWLLLAPIPAALTRDSAHGVRSLNLVVPLAVVTALGFSEFYKFVNKQKVFKVLSMLFATLAYIYSLFIYLEAYYVQSPVQNASQYSYGYKQVVMKVNELQAEYQDIIFDQSFDQPYIFFLFFNKYTPEVYQQNSAYVDGGNGDVGFVTRLDNIEFSPIRWSFDKNRGKTLLVGKPLAFPPEEVYKTEDYKTLVINYPDGNPAFLLVDPK